MNSKNEQGFALVLSLVLMLAMSLMGGALIVISAGDHKSNNTSDDYQQTFYVAETALLEGEKYLLNQYLGPWNPADGKRDLTKRNLPSNETSVWSGKMEGGEERQNYDPKNGYFDTRNYCYNSFKDIDRTDLKIVVAESWNFGKILTLAIGGLGSEEKAQAKKLEFYYYEFFLTQIGAAPFRGFGSSIKKGATDSGSDGMAYRIFGCGIKARAGKSADDRIIISLESTVVLPK
tara:strand:- start:358 stop:1056 length:699 start_codon:yes stop_codon:yes gene_type:complete